MKRIVYLALLFIIFSCTKKQQEIAPDSIYNVESSWERQDAKEIKFADFKGKVLVTAMIYTSCKTSCPRLTAEMASIEKKVENVNPEKLQFVLISIDPENDKPPVMRSYLAQNNFDEKRWTFIRGSEEDTRELANIMALRYKKITPMEFSHSNIISVYSKDGRLAYQQDGLTSDYDRAVVEAIKQQVK